MKYKEFEDIIFQERMRRYLAACDNDTRKAMTLYRYNIRLSQELLAVVCCFEVALRNRINAQLVKRLGEDWLRDLILPDGLFYMDKRVDETTKIISKAYQGLQRNASYSHTRLLAEMEFGVWKYTFSNVQYFLTGQCILRAFPNKPTSSKSARYDNSYIFRELDYINNLRNRIAHHEPICFGNNSAHNAIDTSYAMNRYIRILTLLNWMGIDGNALLYGLGDVQGACYKINSIM